MYRETFMKILLLFAKEPRTVCEGHTLHE